MLFETYGPFDLERDFSTGWRGRFWEAVEDPKGSHEGLSNAIGCYAFCLTFGTKTLPWYVGQAVGLKGFQAEVFTDHKMTHYRNIVEDNRRHRASIFLFPLMKEGTDGWWSFSKNKTNGGQVIDRLEKTLICMALSKNPDLANIRDTKFQRDIYVNGILGGQWPGRPSKAASAARSVFLD